LRVAVLTGVVVKQIQPGGELLEWQRGLAEQFPVAGGGGDDALTPVSGRCCCWGCRNRPAWRRPAGATRWIVIACQPRNSPMGLVAAMPAG